VGIAALGILQCTRAGTRAGPLLILALASFCALLLAALVFSLFKNKLLRIPVQLIFTKR
jgi:hypothetical protein